MCEENKENIMFGDTAGFVHAHIREDLGENLAAIKTRFPPEPNGYLHIGHARNIYLNYAMAKNYGGTFNLRFDDTNPAKEDEEFVKAIADDIKWLGCDYEDRMFFASNYFDKFYEFAVQLIKKGSAFVCDLTAEQIREYRGTLSEPGKESPYRNRSVEENLDLFARMKNGEFADGSRTLRAKIDMFSPNINMRDPVLYRIAKLSHHNTGDKWCIYPMYDYAHPLEDAIEGITHSICTLEFEDHRPFYNWVVNEIDFDVKPRQIEVAKLILSNAVMGKRYNKKLVEEKEVSGWDDPRLVTIRGMRRRGYTPEAIRLFCERAGVSKAEGRTDFAFLEFCVREALKAKAKCVMAVLDPVKLVITNYPEGQVEMMEVENNPETPEMGSRMVPFSREIYVERSDYMDNAPSKFFRLSIGREVRLKGAYFVTCTDVLRDENGNVTEIHCTYDPETKSGSGFTGRKVKGTIHWVSCEHAVRVEARMYDTLVLDDPESEIGIRPNPESLVVMPHCVVEPSVKDATIDDRFQFIRNGYFCLDSKDSKPDAHVFNLTVSMKSSYKPQ